MLANARKLEISGTSLKSVLSEAEGRSATPELAAGLPMIAEGGTRTLTLLPGRDFESRASANSATSALLPDY